MIVRGRLTMYFILIVLTYRLLLHAMPFQWGKPPLFGLYLEIPFRLYWYFHLQDWLVYSKIGSIIFTVLLFLSAILALWITRKNIGFVIFSILYFLYYLSYYTFNIIHQHQMAAIILMPLPFCVINARSRKLLWEGLRYYACFIYFSAFLLKIIHGSFFTSGNGSHSVMNNLAEYLYYYPNSPISELVSFTISNSWITNAGFVIIVLMQGCMGIGFFTKNFDKYLIWVPVILHLSTYIFSDVFFVEMLILALLFLNDKQIEWIHQKISIPGIR